MLTTSPSGHDGHPSAPTRPTDSREPELRLLVAFAPLEGNSNSIEIIAQPVSVAAGTDGGLTVSNLSAIGFDAHPLGDLQIRALADRDGSDASSDLWSVQYHQCFAVNLRRVETMHTTLKRVHRALEKVRGELGPPETFPAYLARCGVALRINSFGFRTGTDTGWHHTNTYEWTDASGMVHEITERLADWRTQPSKQ